jgi:hypothetical protein
LDIVQNQNDLTGTWTIKEPRWLSTNEKKCRLSAESNNRGATIAVREGESLISSLVGKGYAYLSADGKELFTLMMKDSGHSMREFARMS